MINLHIEAKNVADLKSQLREMLAGIEVTDPTVSLIMPTIEPEQLVQALTQPGVNPDPQPEEQQPDVTPDTPADPVVKLEDVRAAANAYRDKHGIEALREIFKKHGGEKLKDIPAANYAALMLEIL